MTNYQMFIGGEWVDSVSGETFSDINPANDEVYATVPKGDARDADRAMAAAYAACRDWAKTSAGERAKLLYKASSTLESRLEEFAEVLISEGGSMFGKAMFETTYTVDLLHTAGEDCRRILGETIPSDHDKLSMTIYQPLGVVVAISPWNFPLLLSINKVAYALAAGNTVVLKPSSETPVIGLKIAELFASVDLPPGVLNVVTGPGGVVGEALVQDDRAALVTFTGETVTGRRIAELAGT
ncbi:MAG: aldehyde dehydrogenase family protein, partial [Deltaproteobacteria bacterium]|nr:aldehyde dehydrogenase family protein [Deltaproteobacteria bacterium]